MSPPELHPNIIADEIESLSMRGMICFAMAGGQRFSMADGGAVVRENPGMSKVVTVKVEERSATNLSNDEQSPSPDGISIRCGPEPLCSTCQDMPSLVSIREMRAISEGFNSAMRTFVWIDNLLPEDSTVE
jgi:hypothetical protein